MEGTVRAGLSKVRRKPLRPNEKWFALCMGSAVCLAAALLLSPAGLPLVPLGGYLGYRAYRLDAKGF